MGHVTEDREGDASGKEASPRVHQAGDNRILDAVVVELVVRAEGGEGPGPDAVGEEDLSSRVDPGLRLPEAVPIGRDILPQAN